MSFFTYAAYGVAVLQGLAALGFAWQHSWRMAAIWLGLGIVNWLFAGIK